MNIYEIRRYGLAAFLAVSVTVVAFFLYYSDKIVSELAAQEHSRMQIWADATKQIISLDFSNQGAGSDMEFLRSIIEDNRTIPVLLTDDDDNIISHRNFDLPEPVDSMQPMYISPVNEAYLREKLEELRGGPNVINIIIGPDYRQHLYYEDSRLLRNLSYYPYIQLLVMIAFVLIVYYAVNSTRRAEQNKVWVGLSKETAHQLGTPISSLMAWMELLPDEGVDPDIVGEMSKDVQRLSTIASRFGKIGSKPSMEPVELNSVVKRSVDYMSTRISSRIKLDFTPSAEPIDASLSTPLFEWVMENLIKNAVDAMPDGKGKIDVSTMFDDNKAVIEVTDTGKGLLRKNFDTIFNPGYTTKSRGWGLGLTLARRIISRYHGGRIFVKRSEPGVGTTFRIELPVK